MGWFPGGYRRPGRRNFDIVDVYGLIITDFYGSGIRKISNSKFHWGSSENRRHWGRPSWSNPFGFQDCGMLLWIKYMAADDMDTAMGT